MAASPLTAVYAALVHVASFSAGGYLAGRTRTPWVEGNSIEQHFRDGSHGFAVWALGIVVGATLAVSGIGGFVNAAVKSTTAVAAAGVAGASANPAVADRLAAAPTDYAVDRLLAPAPQAADAPAPDAAGRMARADVAAPMARTLAANLAAGNTSVDAGDRAYLGRLVSQQTGLPQAAAEKRVEDAYAQLKTAEQKMRDAADQARKATLIAAFLAAATLAIGCAAACAGSALGARHRDENTLIVLFGSRRFW